MKPPGKLLPRLLDGLPMRHLDNRLEIRLFNLLSNQQGGILNSPRGSHLDSHQKSLLNNRLAIGQISKGASHLVSPLVSHLINSRKNF